MAASRTTPPQDGPRRSGADRDDDDPDAPDPDVTQIFRSPQRARVERGAPIELTVVRQTGVSYSDQSQEWVAFEIWTRNRVYLVNGQMRCIGVVNRASHKREQDNAFIGAMLTGGQRRGTERIELSQPFPLPGMRAVFRHTEGSRGLHRFGETSKVDRIVMRLGVTSLDAEKVGQSYHDLTARFFLPTRGGGYPET